MCQCRAQHPRARTRAAHQNPALGPLATCNADLGLDKKSRPTAPAPAPHSPMAAIPTLPLPVPHVS